MKHRQKTTTSEESGNSAEINNLQILEEENAPYLGFSLEYTPLAKESSRTKSAEKTDSAAEKPYNGKGSRACFVIIPTLTLNAF